MKMTSRELLCHPVVIARNDKEKVLIEGSINSVRMSIMVKQARVVNCRHCLTSMHCTMARNTLGSGR